MIKPEGKGLNSVVTARYYMKMRSIFLIIVAFILLSQFTLAAQETLGTFKSGQCVNLRQACSSCSYSNITHVIYPDSSIALGSTVMDRNNANYNYSFCSTQPNGEYVVVGISDVDGIGTDWSYNFFVTPTGVVENSVFNNAIVIMLIVVALVLLGFAGYMHSYPMYFMSGVMWTVGGVYTMIYGFNSYTDTFTRSIALVFIAIGVIFMVTTGYEWIADITDPDEKTYAGDESDESDYFNKNAIPEEDE